MVSPPPPGLHQEEAAIPQSKTADALNATGWTATGGLFKRSKNVHGKTKINSGACCSHMMIGDGGGAITLAAILWLLRKQVCHTFTLTMWSEHTSNIDMVNNSQKPASNSSL